MHISTSLTSITASTPLLIKKKHSRDTDVCTNANADSDGSFFFLLIFRYVQAIVLFSPSLQLICIYQTNGLQLVCSCYKLSIWHAKQVNQIETKSICVYLITKNISLSFEKKNHNIFDSDYFSKRCKEIRAFQKIDCFE